MGWVVVVVGLGGEPSGVVDSSTTGGVGLAGVLVQPLISGTRLLRLGRAVVGRGTLGWWRCAEDPSKVFGRVGGIGGPWYDVGFRMERGGLMLDWCWEGGLRHGLDGYLGAGTTGAFELVGLTEGI